MAKTFLSISETLTCCNRDGSTNGVGGAKRKRSLNKVTGFYLSHEAID